MLRITIQYFGGRGGKGSGGSRGGGRAGGGSAQSKAPGFTVAKEGKRTYAARTPDGYMIVSGTDPAEVAAQAQKKVDMMGVTLGQKVGETRTVTPGSIGKEGFEKAVKTAAVGSTITLKDGTVFTKTSAGNWEGMATSAWGGILSGSNKRRHTIVGSDRFTHSGFSSMKYTKKG